MRIGSDLYNFNDSKFVSLNKVTEVKLLNSLKMNARLNTTLSYELIAMLEDLQANGSEQLKYYLSNPIVKEYISDQRMRHMPQHTFTTANGDKMPEKHQELHRYIKQLSESSKYNSRPAQQTVNKYLRNKNLNANSRKEQALFVLRDSTSNSNINQTAVPANKVINEYAAALLQNVEADKDRKNVYTSQIIYDEKDKYITVSLANILVFVVSVAFLLAWLIK